MRLATPCGFRNERGFIVTQDYIILTRFPRTGRSALLSAPLSFHHVSSWYRLIMFALVGQWIIEGYKDLSSHSHEDTIPETPAVGGRYGPCFAALLRTLNPVKVVITGLHTPLSFEVDSISFCRTCSVFPVTVSIPIRFICSHQRVGLGFIQNVIPVVIKTAYRTELEAESHAYQTLRHLQGYAIPRFLGYYDMALFPFILINRLPGEVPPSFDSLTLQQK